MNFTQQPCTYKIKMKYFEIKTNSTTRRTTTLGFKNVVCGVNTIHTVGDMYIVVDTTVLLNQKKRPVLDMYRLFNTWSSSSFNKCIPLSRVLSH